MYTYWYYPECRKQPGDLILMISISDFLLSGHWLLTALFSAQGPFDNKKDFETFSPFC